MDVQQAFGKAIRDRRIALKLTQDELAERAGLTGKYIGTVERGERDPGLFSMQILAKALGAALADLMGGSSISLSERALEAAKEFDQTDPQMQEAVLELLRATQRHAPPRPHPAAHTTKKTMLGSVREKRPRKSAK